MTRTTLPTFRPITQNWNMDFHWLNGRYYPNGFYASIGWFGHNGLDFGCHEGDPVEAVCDGVIEFAGAGNDHWLLSGGGNAILLRNDELGIRFEYLHLSRFEVTHGQRVKVGQVIARSGNTGISTAPHLHLGAIPIRNVNVNNGYRGRIDPTPYLYGPMNPDYATVSPAAGPTIRPIEEDDMFSDEDRKKLIKVVDDVHRTRGVSDSTEEPLHDKLLRVNRFIKGDKDDSVYELAGGKLRGLTALEWKLTGKKRVDAIFPQSDIDKMPKV